MKSLFLLLVPIITSGQTVYRGNIINRKTKEKVPYATVGLAKENIGINADENGNFTLNSKKSNLNDTLVISCIGYETLRLPSTNLIASEAIELDAKETTLKEVIVNSKHSWMFANLNEITNCGNSYYSTSGYVTQVAQHFHTEAANVYLKSVEICKYSIPILDPDRVKFRVRVYGMDTFSKAPSMDLCNEIIEVKANSKHIKVNLEKYKIRIPENDFFVAVEWLKIPYNASKGIEKIDGKKIEHISYGPLVGWSAHLMQNFGRWYTSKEIWILNYKGKWTQMNTPEENTKMSISAMIKY